MNHACRTIALLIAFAVAASTAVAFELTLFSMPSPREIDWSKPASLARTAITNRLTLQHFKHKHAIGHVFVELTDGGQRRFLGGMIPAPDAGMGDLVLKQGYGLGILFTPVKGQFDSPEGLEGELKDRYKSGRIAFIRFELSAATFERLWQYVQGYRERGYDKIYNGLNQPRAGKGAGCSAFGVSFLEVAGLLHPVWEKVWKINVRIPREFVGGPMTGAKVPLTRVLGAKRWAEEDEPHFVLSMYEPYKIWQWVGDTWRKEQQAPSNRVSLLKRGKALGLNYDVRHVKVPAEPIFIEAD